jgi:putative spermidine/putrescine transport system ATP-binding protein
VRPEKIAFIDQAACSIGGTVRTRIFQGNHWLYQIDTACGLVTVIRQNAGETMPAEGAAVRLTWRPQDMAIAPAMEGSS